MKTIYTEEIKDIFGNDMIITGVREGSLKKEICLCSLPEGWKQWKLSESWSGDWTHVEYRQYAYTPSEEDKEYILVCTATLVTILHDLGCPGIQISGFGWNLWDMEDLKTMLKPDESTTEEMDVMYCLLDESSNARAEAILKNARPRFSSHSI